MKQFFEQYGGVALGILALFVLIAMITPVGNIVKTSLQSTVQTFSAQINAQTDSALERSTQAQNSALSGIAGSTGGSLSSTYTLSFESNGGTTASNVTVSNVPDSLPVVTRTGFDFAGWYTDSSLTNQVISQSELTEDTTLYAKWNIVTYDISYNLDGGSASTLKTDYTIADSSYVLPTPTKNGSTFKGWYDNASFTGSPVTTLGAGSYGDKTYYAKWKENLVLAAPTISISGTTLTIEPVANATTYEVYVNDVLVLETSETSVDLSSYRGSASKNVKVRAKADDEGQEVTSEYSTSVVLRAVSSGGGNRQHTGGGNG